MGRYYSGDIEGKFWFAVQDSRDASHFGGQESPIVDEESDEAVGSHYIFTKEDLPDIQDALDQCISGLGDNKEKLDQFFEGCVTYNEKQVAEHLEIEGEEKEVKMLTLAMLMLYARLGLGEKIKACVEEKGQCEFDADYYYYGNLR